MFHYGSLFRSWGIITPTGTLPPFSRAIINIIGSPLRAPKSSFINYFPPFLSTKSPYSFGPRTSPRGIVLHVFLIFSCYRFFYFMLFALLKHPSHYGTLVFHMGHEFLSSLPHNTVFAFSAAFSISLLYHPPDPQCNAIGEVASDSAQTARSSVPSAAPQSLKSGSSLMNRGLPFTISLFKPTFQHQNPEAPGLAPRSVTGSIPPALLLFFVNPFPPPGPLQLPCGIRKPGCSPHHRGLIFFFVFAMAGKIK